MDVFEAIESVVGDLLIIGIVSVGFVAFICGCIFIIDIVYAGITGKERWHFQQGDGLSGQQQSEDSESGNKRRTETVTEICDAVDVSPDDDGDDGCGGCGD